MAAPGPATVRRPRGSLTADEIVAVAAELLRDEGVDGFSMRKLAARLGVNPMTVYLRFDSREDLLDAVVADALPPLDAPPAEGPWADRVVAWCVAIRDQLLAARHLLPLLSPGRHLAPSMVGAADIGLDLMTEAGRAGDDAIDGFRVLFWHAVAWALVRDSITERSADDVLAAAEAHGLDPASPAAAMLHQHPDVDPDALFLLTTRALVRGLGAP